MSELDTDNIFVKDCILQFLSVPSLLPGTLVYYDAGNACYKPARAILQSDSITGLRSPAPSCYILGIVISNLATGGSTVLLKQGYFKSSDIEATLGIGAAAGIYYLSPSNSGMAVADPGEDIRIPCISYYGNNAFSFIPSQYVKIRKDDVVVKGLRSNTLTISNSEQGILRIELPDKDYYWRLYYPVATAQLTRDSVTYTNIVSKLFSGAGIQVTNMGYGCWRVTAKSALNSKLPATDFTLNGAQRAADALLTYTVFPANAVTSMIMSLPVSFILASDSFDGTVSVWMTTRGPGIATYTVNIYWIPYTASTNIPSSPIYTGEINTYNSSTTQLSLVQTGPASVHFTGQGTMVAKIQTKSAPSNDCYIHQTGFLFTQASSEHELIVSNSSPILPTTEQTIRDIIAEYLRWQS